MKQHALSCFTMLLWTLLVAGCGQQMAPSNEPGISVSRPSESSVMSGDKDKGDLVLAFGTVLDPTGKPCANATVTLEQNLTEYPGRRHLTVLSGTKGGYRVYGESASRSTDMIWAATPDGKLGAAWIPSTWHDRGSKPVDIELRGGKTLLYVCDLAAKPVPNAIVGVCLSGIEDMSGEVPPNIKRLLERTTDRAGIVRYPSRLADYDLGFEVVVEGHGKQRCDDYSGLSRKQFHVFVLDGDFRDRARCEAIIQSQIQAQSQPDPSDEPGDARELPIARELNG